MKYIYNVYFITKEVSERPRLFKKKKIIIAQIEKNIAGGFLKFSF